MKGNYFVNTGEMTVDTVSSPSAVTRSPLTLISKSTGSAPNMIVYRSSSLPLLSENTIVVLSSGLA